jgi:signal transduction histidine kinase
MGRLFWKFFIVFWIAQISIFLTVGLMLLAWPSAALDTPFKHPMEQSSKAGGAAVSAPTRPEGDLPPPLPLGAGLLVSLAFAAWLSWYFSRPIRSLNSAFEALADGKLDTRVGKAMGTRRDELADLGQAFDRSAGKLQALVDSQRRLLHDVSHELRSPLARLQACSDLMVQQPDRAGELVQRIERETGRMDKLVGELLTLARLESATSQAPFEVVDLIELAHSICSDAEIEMQAKSCRLQTKIPVELQVKGDAELLYRALDNVLRNAVRFSPLGGTIELQIAANTIGNNVLICITDEGPGLPLHDLDRIFEAFFRSDSNSEKGDHGSGLGLAIARSVVLVHQGNISARNRASGGLEVMIALPCN